jgi:Leucine-rich repeat (LRR) protein
LTNVSVSNNNLESQDISLFGKFTSLKELCVGNDIEERSEKNHFTGSLEFLKDLTKLEKLQIEETGVDEDSEHFAEGLKVIFWYKETVIKKLNSG